jgi:hypothetical protein
MTICGCDLCDCRGVCFGFHFQSRGRIEFHHVATVRSPWAWRSLIFFSILVSGYTRHTLQGTLYTRGLYPVPCMPVQTATTSPDSIMTRLACGPWRTHRTTGMVTLTVVSSHAFCFFGRCTAATSAASAHTRYSLTRLAWHGRYNCRANGFVQHNLQDSAFRNGCGSKRAFSVRSRCIGFSRGFICISHQ